MTIKNKLRLTFFLMTMLMIFIGVIGNVSLNEVSNESNKIINNKKIIL